MGPSPSASGTMTSPWGLQRVASSDEQFAGFFGGHATPTGALFVVTPSTFVSMVRRARVDLSDNPVFVEPTK